VLKIIVQDNDWDGARSKLKSSLEEQSSAFSASLKAAFAPTTAAAKPAAPQVQPPAEPRPQAETILTRRPFSRLA
jgi:hypothetical protein